MVWLQTAHIIVIKQKVPACLSSQTSIKMATLTCNDICVMCNVISLRWCATKRNKNKCLPFLGGAYVPPWVEMLPMLPWPIRCMILLLYLSHVTLLLRYPCYSHVYCIFSPSFSPAWSHQSHYCWPNSIEIEHLALSNGLRSPFLFMCTLSWVCMCNIFRNICHEILILCAKCIFPNTFISWCVKI